MVAVAQLVRASDCGSEGRGFETHQLPPFNINPERNLFRVNYFNIILRSCNLLVNWLLIMAV